MMNSRVEEMNDELMMQVNGGIKTNSPFPAGDPRNYDFLEAKCEEQSRKAPDYREYDTGDGGLWMVLKF